MVNLSHKLRFLLLFIGSLLIMVSVGGYYGLIGGALPLSATLLASIGAIGMSLVLIVHSSKENYYP